MIIIWSILYLIAYLGAFVLCFILLTSAIGGILTFFWEGKHIEIGTGSLEVSNKLLVIALLFISIPLPYFLFLGVFNYNPPFIPPNVNVISSASLDNHLIELEQKEKFIEETLSNIENLTLNQISSEFSDILDYVKELKTTAVHQKRIIDKLENIRNDEKKKTDELIKKSEELERITKPQLNAIKQLITEDCNEQNAQSFWLGIFISFPVGVFASFIANYIWKRMYLKNK